MTKTKTISVTEFDPGPSNEYMADRYPELGKLYWVARSRLLAIPYKPSGAAGGIVLGFCLPPEVSVELISEPEFVSALSAAAPAFGEDFVLRALAIAQTPSLAVQLLAPRSA